MFKKRTKSLKLIKSAFKVEALESRILLSGDPVVAAMPTSSTNLLEPNGPLDAFTEQYTLSSFKELNDAAQQTSGYERPEADSDFVVDDTAFDAANITSDLYIAGGNLTISETETLGGSGSIELNVTNSGTLSPGYSPGIQTISGNLINTDSSETIIELAGTDNSDTNNPEYDQINVTENIVFDGDLSIELLDGFTPVAGDEFIIMTFGGSASGSFDSISGIAINSSLYFDVVQDNNNKELKLIATAYPTAGGFTASDFYSSDADSILRTESIQITSPYETVNGNNILVPYEMTAGSDGTGTLQLGTNTSHNLNGDGDSSNDELILRAPEDIVIYGAVGNSDPLEKLTIEGVNVDGTIDNPNNVTFKSTVEMDGDLIIYATGTVTFEGEVTINDGDLLIYGADKVVFESGADVTLNGDGDILIEGNEITLNGGNESLRGSGTITLRPANEAFNIELGTPPSSASENTLNIDNSELKSFADGFEKIILGYQDSVTGHAVSSTGDVRIGAINEGEQPTLRDNLEVYGGTITVEDYLNNSYTLQVLGDITLDAVGDITVKNTVEANSSDYTTLEDITLYSQSGSITQENVTGDGKAEELIIAENLNVSAQTGMTLLWTAMDTLDAVNTGVGDILIHTQAYDDLVYDGKDLTSDLNIKQLLQEDENESSNITLSTELGDITVLSAESDGLGISTAGSGNILLVASSTANQTGQDPSNEVYKQDDDGKTITVNQAITSTTGAITLLADGQISNASNGSISATGKGNITLISQSADIAQNANVSSVGGDISFDAATNITMADGTSTDAGAGSVTYTAGQNITLSTVNAQTAITMTAETGYIWAVNGSADTYNLSGETASVILSAVTGVGTTDAVLKSQIAGLTVTNTQSGGLYLTESTDLEILADGLTLSGSTGDAIITLSDGSLTTNGEILLNGTSGNLRINVQGDNHNVTINNNIESANGSLSLFAADSIIFGGSSLVTTLSVDQTVQLLATAGAISMANNATLRTNGGNVRLDAGTDIVIGTVDLRVDADRSSASLTGQVDWGSIAINAGSGTITDAAADGDSTVDIYAQSLHLSAGLNIGEAGDHIETEVVAVAAEVTEGGIYLTESTALTLSTVTDVVVNQVATDGSITSTVAGDSLSGLSVTEDNSTDSNDDVVLINTTGSLILDQAVAVAGNGNIRIQAESGVLDINQSISTATGHITILADGDMDFAAEADLSTGSGGVSGDINVQVTGSSNTLTMADTTLFSTNTGQLRLESTGTITLGQLDARSAADRSGDVLTNQATWGDVSILSSSGSLIDAGTDSNTAIDIYSNNLRLQVATNIANNNKHLTIESAQLSALATAGGLYISEKTDLSLASTAVTTQLVKTDGTTTESSSVDEAQSNLASGADLVLIAEDGSITTEATGAVNAAGNLLIAANGATSDLTLNGVVNNTAGHSSLQAGQDLFVNANISASTEGKTVDLLATRHITMADGTILTTVNGDISAVATTGTLTSEIITAGTGNVALQAGVAITDRDADSLITADGLLLSAGSGIADSDNVLNAAVNTVTASADAGGFFITETDGLTVDSVTVTVQRVDGTASDDNLVATAQTQEDISTTNGGAVVMTVTIGDLTVNGGTASATSGLTAAGNGNVRLDAVAGALALNAGLEAGSGNVTLLASGDLTQAADGDISSTAGDIDVQAGGNTAMSDSATVTTTAGNIRYKVTDNLTLGSLASTSGHISLIANSITDSGTSDTDLAAVDLRVAITGENGGFGLGDNHIETNITNLSATAGTAGFFMTEADGISITQLSAITTDRVEANGTTSSNTDAARSDLISSGALVLQSSAGSITVTNENNATGVSAKGNLLLSAEGATSDLILNADIVSKGHISLSAGQDILQNADISAASEGKTVDLLAERHITMASGTTLTTTDGNISAVATTGTLTSEIITAGTGNIALQAGVDITDRDADSLITASGLLLNAGSGIGNSDNVLNTAVTTVTASADSDGLFITETAGITVDSVTVTVQRVDGTASDAAIAQTQEDLSTTNGGAMVMTVTTGDLIINGGTDSAASGLTAAGAGNVRLDAVAGALALNAGLEAGSGNVTLLASGDLTQAADGDISSTAGDIDVQTGGNTAMSDGATVTTTDGNIRYVVTGSLSLGSLASTNGHISLIADSMTDSGTDDTDLAAQDLRVEVSGGFGESGNHIETSVAQLSATAGSAGFFMTEADDLTITELAAITTNRVKADGTTTDSSNTDAMQSDLISSGALVLQSTAGSITVAEGDADDTGVSAAGNLLLSAASDLILYADIVSNAGHISLSAGQDILQNADISAATTEGNTVDLLAARDITMAAGTTLTTVNGDISAVATTGTITSEIITAGTGNVALQAGVDITDRDADSLITADGLLLNAGSGIGSSANVLNTTVTTVTASADSDGFFITETAGLTVDSVTVTVQRVDGTASDVAIAQTQEDLSTTNGGAMVMTVTTGDLIINGGTDSAASGLTAAGAGNVRLDVVDGAFTLNAGLEAGSGNVTLLASGALTQAADGDISSTAGDIDVEVGGNAVMADGATIATTDGNIRYAVTGSLSLGSLASTNGHISLIADSMTDSGTDDTDLTAQNLRIAVTGGFGESGNHIETSVAQLSATAGSAGFFMTETDDLTITELAAITTNRVKADGTTTDSSNTDAAQSDLISSGALVLQSSAGSITVAEGDADDTGVSAAGNLLLSAASDLILNADIDSNAGHISLSAGQDILQNADVSTATAGKTIEANAVRAITMDDGVQTLTTDGNIRYAAQSGNVATAVNLLTLSSLDAGAAGISLIAGSILDGGDTHRDITASSLRLNATVGIGNDGTVVNALDTEVTTLTAASRTDGIFINELDTLTIDSVTAMSVSRVTDTAVVTDTTDAAQEDLSTINNGSVSISATELTVNAGTEETRAIYLSGTGNAKLEARTGNLSVNGQIELDNGVGSGKLHLQAQGDIELAAVSSILYTDNGSVYLETEAAITMADGASIFTLGGDVRLDAVNTISLGLINAGAGSVALNSTAGQITDNQTPVANTNVIADGLLINAHSGVASSANNLETTVNKLSVQSSNGSVFMHDTTSVAVDQVTVNVQQVSNADVLSELAVTQSDLVTTAGDIILNAANTLTLNDGDTDNTAIVSASGNIRLSTTANSGASVIVNSGIDAGTGNVSIHANLNIQQGAAGDIVTTAGTLDLIAASGAIVMADGATSQTNGGNIRYQAATDVALALLDARTAADRESGALDNQSEWGHIRVSAESGTITTADTNIDIYAQTVRLDAGTAIATAGNHIATEAAVLTALADNGAIYLDEATSIAVDTVADVQVNRVATDGSDSLTVADSDQSDLTTLGSDGHIVLTTTDGSIVINEGLDNDTGVSANGAGNVLLEANGASHSITVNADIASSTGHLTLRAADSLAINADLTTATGGTISLDAEGGALTMAGTSTIVATNSSVRLNAATDVTVGNIRGAEVSIISGEDIVNAEDSTKNVTAGNLRLAAEGAIGVAGRHISTDIDQVSASAATGSIYLSEDNGITVTDVSVSVTEFNADASTTGVTDDAQSDLTTGSNGNIALLATVGDITLNDGTDGDSQAVTANGSGHILLDAMAGSVTANADLQSGTGHITMKGGVDVDLTENVDVLTQSTGTISLDAEGGALTMAGSSTIAATNSSVRLNAATDVTVGNIRATEVSIISGEDIVNAEDSTKNVTAGNLRLAAEGAIGVAGRHISTDIDQVSASAATGSIYLSEDNGITVTDVSVSVTEFNADASTTGVTDDAQSDLTTGNNGNIALLATVGDITLNDGTDGDSQAVTANGSGHILLDAMAGSVTANADLQSGTGHITMKGGVDVDLTENVDVLTQSTGTISLDAEGGALTMAGTSTIEATDSSVRLNAATDVTVGNIRATGVSIISGEDIVNAEDSTKNVTAGNLRLAAEGAIGVAGRHISTDIDQVSASAATGSIYLSEDNGITVTDVSVSVTEFNADASTTGVTDDAQSDLTTGSNGNIALLATLGDITLNDGTDGDSQAVTANGNGHILLDAMTGSVTANADLQSGTGHITMKGGVDVDLTENVDVLTQSTGTISLDAEGGALTMAGSSTIAATNSSVRLNAATDVTVGNIRATEVSIISGEDIVNAEDSTKNVTAGNLRLAAEGAIGVAGRHISTDIDQVSASAATGSIYLSEDNGITVTDVSVSVTEFNADASTTGVTDDAQSDLTTGSNGNIALLATVGDISLNDGTDGDSQAVNANGSGHILLDAMTGSVTANADLQSGTGHITMKGGVDVDLTENVDVLTQSTGTISLDAEGGALTMAGSSTIEATDSSVRLNAATDVTVGNIRATEVSIISGEDIVNAEDSTKNVTAGNLRLAAAGAIGVAERHISTDIDQVSASAATGSIYLSEDNGITVTDVSVSVTEFNADASTTGVTDDAQSDLTTGSNGNIALLATVGDITLNDGTDGDSQAVTANGNGHILLDAMAGSVTANADLQSGTGHITMKGGVDVDLTENVDVLTQSTGTISLDAEGGALTMAGTSTIEATDSSVRLNAATDVSLGNVTATNVSVVADSGRIVNSADSTMNVTATTLRLEADDAIASSDRHLTTTVTTLSALSTGSDSAGIFITETDSITVDTVTVSVTEMNADTGTTVITDSEQSDLTTLGSNGHIVLSTTDGSIVINEGIDNDTGVSAHGAGNVLLEANGTGRDITVNADIASSTGHLTLRAEGSIAINADLTTATDGTISLDAEGGALTMAGTSTIEATDSSVRLNAETDVSLGNVTATNVSVVADTGSIVNSADSSMNVTATNLRLEADDAIASSDRHLTTTVATVSALSTGSDSAGIFITETDSITVDTVTVSVTEMNTDAGTTIITDSEQSDLTTLGSDGHIVLTSTDGSIVINEGLDNDTGVSANGAGNVLLEANGASHSITVNADITSTTGHLTLRAADSLAINADLTTATGGTISLDAEGGALTMAGTSTIEATDSSVRLNAATDVSLGNVTATNVSVVADSGSIVNSADSSMNVTATTLRLEADDAIASSDRHLTTTVATVSALSTGRDSAGIFITETDSITVDTVTVSVTEMATDAGTTVITDSEQSDLTTLGSDGHIVLTTTDGSIVINEGLDNDTGVSAHGAGNVLLEANGEGRDITINADIDSATGHLTLRAADSLVINADLTTATDGTISLDAEGGALTMAGSTTIAATNSSVLLNAATDVSLGNVTATNVSVVADSGSIVNSADSTMNVTATTLRLEADDAIASSDRHLTTTVTTLSALSTGSDSAGIFITETDSITVDTVTVSVTEMATDAGTTVITDSEQSDLTTLGSDGHIVLTTTDGSIVINEGLDNDTGVSAHGAGNVLLEANGEGRDITVNADITSTTGHLTLRAADSLVINADLTTATDGTISLDAEGGALTMVGTSTIEATDSSVRLNAATDVSLGNVVAANVSVVADSGSINNSANSSMNVTATTLRLEADGAIASSDRHLTTTVATVRALSTGTDSAGIFITETDSITVDTVTVSVTEMNADAGTTVITDSEQSDLTTLGSNGNIVLSTTDGSIVINEGLDNDTGVSANGAGHVLLEANGEGRDITVNADIDSTTGHLTLRAAGSIAINADLTTATDGTISLDAEGGALTMAGTSTIEATDSSVRLNAATDVSLGNVTATNVSVVADTGRIVNSAGSSMNVTATTLRLEADDAIASSDRHLTTTVATVSALSTGTDSAGIFITETDSITVDTVTVSVTEMATQTRAPRLSPTASSLT